MKEPLTSQNILLDFLIGRKWRWLRHFLMIIILAIFFYNPIPASSLTKVSIKNPQLFIQRVNLASVVLFILAVSFIYFNLLMLTPKLLLKNKYLYYSLAAAISIIIYFFIDTIVARYFFKDYADLIPLPEYSFKGFIDSAFIPIVFLGASAGHQIFKKWVTDTQLLAEIREAKVQEELTNLKNQINPHFLFNTLNNLNTLISVNPDKASSVVLGLSDVLRYQLYEANANKVLLKKDIAILQRILELEKIRRDNFQFSIQIDGDVNGKMVPPFIFINFVENAIKHSADNKGFSYLALHFIITNKELQFNCKNSVPEIAPVKKEGGIGLQNVRRRLELLYGNEFDLAIDNNKKEFVIQLKLPL